LAAVFLAGFRSVNLAILLDANLVERMAPPGSQNATRWPPSVACLFFYRAEL
jgi:hypothetical protein